MWPGNPLQLDLYNSVGFSRFIDQLSILCVTSLYTDELAGNWNGGTQYQRTGRGITNGRTGGELDDLGKVLIEGMEELPTNLVPGIIY